MSLSAFPFSRTVSTFSAATSSHTSCRFSFFSVPPDSGSRRKSERIKRNCVLKQEQRQRELMISASENEESLEAVSQPSSSSQLSVKKNASKEADKRKRKEANHNHQESEGEDDDDDDIKIDKEIIKVKKQPLSTGVPKPSSMSTTSTKIAPIFQPRNSSSVGNSSSAKTCGSKITEDPAKLAARKAFLLSSVPDSLKDRHRRWKMAEDQSESWVTPFASKIGHVRQFPKEWLELGKTPKSLQKGEEEESSNEDRPQSTSETASKAIEEAAARSSASTSSSSSKLKWRKIDEERLEERLKVVFSSIEENSDKQKPLFTMEGYHGTMIAEALAQKKDKKGMYCILREVYILQGLWGCHFYTLFALIIKS